MTTAGADTPLTRLALFGTSADPPTRGHRALLEGLLGLFPQVVTWASDNPLKQHGAPLEVRTALLEALVGAIADPRLSLEPQLSSPWAVETLERARARWPQRELVFVVGSDLAGQIPRWKRADALLRSCRLGIARREGWPLETADLEQLRGLGATLDLLPLAIPPSASSRIRERPDPAQVPSELWPVLLQHNLYGLSEP
ncbi:nicotinate-nucleotide adenylyltransferase [Synechococcus sp. CCY 0621]|uniref:nicotinate-nucleotide adenylyltransferase n=1 Tax=Synechococcus sp. CCY 0621 TaxID=2815603 RepID=UPI001C2356E6